MIKETFIQLYSQNFEKLKVEINKYQEEANIWHVPQGVANCGGNLCLHLTGNLNAFIGVGLADSGYIRDREREFAAKDVPRSQLIADIENTKEVVLKGIATIEAEKMGEAFDMKIWNEPKTLHFTLTRLLTHFDYHLGQINYHRRIVEG